MRICLMIEGQEDVSWDRWLEIASACESAGLAGLFRSDHYLSVAGRPDRGALDAWGTICALAAVTNRLQLGTLVSPVTFRHPSVLAKLAATADHISRQGQPGGGRVELGLGAGWWEAEHRAYGFEFPDTPVRMEMLAEQLELIRRQWTESGLSLEGRHYRVEHLDARPRPTPAPRIIVGGRAGPRSAALAARWADEYNTINATPEDVAERRAAVRSACEQIGRDPAELSFSVMTGFLLGRDRDGLRERARRLAEWQGEDPDDPDAFIDGLPETWVVGSPEDAVAQLRALAQVGTERVMLQHHLHGDQEVVELIGEELVPALA
jgi:alkanesulfonate monooxygenase SsuD/methylene tetrahydromethanopterin reductase-like flavin-dependent oxidoreductase (luciferase family)